MLLNHDVSQERVYIIIMLWYCALRIFANFTVCALFYNSGSAKTSCSCEKQLRALAERLNIVCAWVAGNPRARAGRGVVPRAATESFIARATRRTFPHGGDSSGGGQTPCPLKETLTYMYTSI